MDYLTSTGNKNLLGQFPISSNLHEMIIDSVKPNFMNFKQTVKKVKKSVSTPLFGKYSMCYWLQQTTLN